MSETIIAVYKTPAQAESAVQDLLDNNVSASSIDRHTSGGTFRGGSSSFEARPAESKGFWASLFGGEDHDATRVYDENLTSGGSVVTVRGVSEGEYDRIGALLERHDPVDVDDGLNADESVETTTTQSFGAAPIASLPMTDNVASDEGTLSLSEEQIKIGKRLVNRGSTRIHRFIVERPVEENVTLREEKVVVERRPVTGGSIVPDAAFTDKVIEMVETREEAVVGKTAHVVEEVSLRKEAVDRVETIRDTVRKEEVEVERVPTDELAANHATAPILKP